MASLTQTEGPVQDVLLYGRNSTDDQAEAGTIQSQQHFLRHYAELYRLRIVGQFWDEGISGTVPFEQRREGRKLARWRVGRRHGLGLFHSPFGQAHRRQPNLIARLDPRIR